jgi:diaminopimelate epimerase
VNFIQITGPRKLRIRTYERGVEGETLACGTGSVAAALIAGALGAASSPVEVLTWGGEKLIVSFERTAEGFGNIRLEGEARVICEGMVYV